MFFSCKKRTKRTLKYKSPQGFKDPGAIFVWSFFGSFFAKKEHTRRQACTWLTRGSPRSKARAFSIVVMAILCSAVRVKNA